MYKEILAHKNYMEHELQKTLSEVSRRELYSYHIDRVHDFQHERLIHLLVTFFFGFLLIISLVALLLFANLIIAWPLGVLSLILFVLEIAYIRHYYQLENGVQSLYAITVSLSR